jgi:excisionase family DNA binding protein
MSTPPRSYSTTEIAQRLGISTQTVQRWVDTGKLKAWKTLGGHRRIEAEGAERLLRMHDKVVPVAPPAKETARAQEVEARSVLVVDDNPDDRDVLVHLVATALPEVHVAAADNGFHGLVAIGRMAPDVVITDLMMPHINGFEMLRHLLAGCAVRPRVVLAVSSNPLADLAHLGHLPEGVPFLQKPLDPELFRQTLLAALETQVSSQA